MKRFTTSLLALTAVVVLGCGGTTPPAADTQAVRNPPVYLALGDSVPFGYASSAIPPRNDNVFDVYAYPWYLAPMIDLPLVDAACEGQTANGFINHTGTDRGCFEFRELYPQGMHVDYSTSQLDFA